MWTATNVTDTPFELVTYACSSEASLHLGCNDYRSFFIVVTDDIKVFRSDI